MNIAAKDNCVLMAVISQKFVLLAHFCIAGVLFLLTKYNYRRVNGGAQFTGSKCNWSVESKRNETSRFRYVGKKKKRKSRTIEQKEIGRERETIY